MYQEISLRCRLQRCMKCRYQFVRQVADKSHGIGNNDISGLAQPELARGRVERGEQLVRGVGVRVGQRVEQRRFEVIGVG